MSKQSTVTARQAPVQGASATSGSLLVRADSLAVRTSERIELVDLTDRLTAFVTEAAVRDGMLSVWSLHTTCAIFINEAQPALHADIKRALEQIIRRDSDWMHIPSSRTAIAATPTPISGPCSSVTA
jgi:hypothetical protein